MRQMYTLSLAGKSKAMREDKGRALLMLVDPCKPSRANAKVAGLLLVTVPLTEKHLLAAGKAGILEGVT